MNFEWNQNVMSPLIQYFYVWITLIFVALFPAKITNKILQLVYFNWFSYLINVFKIFRTAIKYDVITYFYVMQYLNENEQLEQDI